MKKYSSVLLLSILFSLVFASKSGLEAQNIDSLINELSQAEEDTNRALILYELGWQLKESQPSLSESYATKSLELSEKLNFFRGVAFSASLLGFHFRTKGDFNQSEYFYEKSLEARKKIGSRLDIARAHYNLGKLYFEQARYSKAIDHYQLALILLHGSNENIDLARIANSLGAAYRHLGYYEKAVKVMEYGNQLRVSMMLSTKSRRDSLEFAKSQLNLGSLHYDEGDLVQSDELFHSALHIFSKTGSLTDQADAINNIGLVLVSRSKLDSAQILFIDALSKYEKNHDSLGIAQCLLNLGKVDLALSNDEEAIKSITRANAIYGGLGIAEGAAKAEFQLGSIASARKNYHSALEHFQKSIQFARESEAILTVLDSEVELSKVYSNLEKPGEAFMHSQIALQLKDSLHTVFLSSIFADAQIQRLQSEKKLLQSQSAANLQGKLYAEQLNITYIIGLILLVFIIIALSYILRSKSRFIRLERERMTLRENANRNAEAIRQMMATQEQKLMIAVATGQEGERSRISQELHDSLGGLLSIMKLHSQSLQMNVASSELETQRRIADIREMIDKAVQEVRRISKNLASGLLSSFGIEAALNDLRDAIQGAEQIRIRLAVFGFENEARLPYSFELTLYQITQELVSNTLRHANASEIEIELIRHQNRITLMVSDNGRGFLRASTQNAGQGLNSIEYRVQVMNGEFSIDSGRGNGTTITIELPYNPNVL